MAPKFLNKKSALAAILAGAVLAALPTAQAMPQSTESATAQSILANAAVEASPPIGLTIKPAAGNASLMAYHTSHASHASHVSHVSHASHTSSHY